MNVEVYTTPTCGYCHQAKEYLRQRGIPFVEHDVSRDRAAASEMVQRTGQMGVPVIVIDGETVVGFDRPRLDLLLRQAGARRPSLGLKVADARSLASKMPALAGQAGAYVGGVRPGSPGAAAGIAAGDLIVAVDGRPIEGAADLEQAAHGRRRFVLTVVREGQTRQVAVSL